MRVFVTGIDGFIGSRLTARILAETDWHVEGIDLSSRRIGQLLGHSR